MNWPVPLTLWVSSQPPHEARVDRGRLGSLAAEHSWYSWLFTTAGQTFGSEAVLHMLSASAALLLTDTALHSPRLNCDAEGLGPVLPPTSSRSLQLIQLSVLRSQHECPLLKVLLQCEAAPGSSHFSDQEAAWAAGAGDLSTGRLSA